MSTSIPSGPKCPRCAAELPADAIVGLCPRCLMVGAMQPTQDGDPAESMPTPTPEEIAVHFPQLEVIELLGRGGMGVVYKARQKTLGRLVALKLLAPERVGDPKFAERFAHEAKALAALNHPSIVTIHDFGQAGGFFYLLMEFVDGVNLRQAMKAGRFTPEQALAIVPPVCEALQYAHEHGIVHRDIKPENLLLDREGRVKIADFGIAKIMGAEVSGVGLAESQPAGTPQYMAPEQKEHRVTDHRADIYSLGVVLYEMLTGELPADRLQPPSRRVQVDVRIDEIVLRALEQKPELRFATAADFRTQVESIANPPAVRTTAPRSTARSIALTALLLILGVLIPVVGLSLHNRSVRAAADDHMKYLRTLQDGVVSLSTQIGEANAVAGRAASRAGNSAEREETHAQAREEQRTYEQRSVNLRADLDRLHAALAAARDRQVDAHPWRVVLLVVTGALLALAGVGMFHRNRGPSAVDARHALPLNFRLILGAAFFLCLLNFAGPHITRMGASPEPTFEIGLSQPWLVVHPQYVDHTRYVRALKWNFGSSSFISGIIAAVIAATLLLSRRNVHLHLRWSGWFSERGSGTNRSEQARAAVTGPPRISRLAVIGACWIPVSILSFVAAKLASYQGRGGSAAGPEWWELAVLIPAMILVVVGPFGTTILGWLAVSQIRRSSGRIHGLPLALFDALVFPLGILGAVIAVAGVALAKLLVDFYANPSVIGRAGVPLITRTANWLSPNNEVAVFVGVAAAIVVNALIVRAVLRAVRKDAAAATPERSATGNQIKLASLALIFALMSTALGALAALRPTGAWLAMALALGFAGAAILLALPVRRLGAGKCALIIAGLGMVLWPLVALVSSLADTAGVSHTFGPEIERVEVGKDQAVIKARGSDDAGLIFMLGTETDRWTPAGLYLDAMWDVTLGRGGFERGVRWTIKARRGITWHYKLDGPPGPMLGMIVFHPGTPAPEAYGSFVIGEFRPDNGKPLPISVRLEKSDNPARGGGAQMSGPR